MSTHEEQLAWFRQFRSSTSFGHFSQRPIAYFCAEYALADKVPTYAGGLGVLAGDVVREAGDRGVPMVAMGLYYHHGYVCAVKEMNGRILEACEATGPEDVGLKPVVDDHGRRIKVEIPVQDRDVTVKAWMWRDESVVVYLMDTNCEENTANDRIITDRLYVGDKEMRLKQQLVLGIGGLRLLEAMGMHPGLYHLNEGHSAFLALELIRHEMNERELGFHEAKQFARRRMVMTNHTLVAAGNEVYSNDLVALMLARYAEELQVPVDELVKLGLVQESSSFSMTMLALRMAGVANAVSKLHAEKAREIWADHPMVAVTNGVHAPTWDLVKEVPRDKGFFWEIHRAKKKALLATLATQDPTCKEWTEDTLLIGWARRFVQYKRPLAILKDVQRFKEIATAQGKEVRLVYAGIPHPSDKAGQAMLKELRELMDGELRGLVAYVPEYSLEEAKLLVSGCDVWLNTPVVGFEACGTSGMKAAMNGVLPFSTNDGWVHEAEMLDVGWRIDDVKISTDALDTLEREIVPLYYDRDADGVPVDWERNMRNARDMGLNQFSATRMLRQYVQLLYT